MSLGRNYMTKRYFIFNVYKETSARPFRYSFRFVFIKKRRKFKLSWTYGWQWQIRTYSRFFWRYSTLVPGYMTKMVSIDKEFVWFHWCKFVCRDKRKKQCYQWVERCVVRWLCNVLPQSSGRPTFFLRINKMSFRIKSWSLRIISTNFLI